MIRKLLFFKFAPVQQDLGLLALRLLIAAPLLIRHGFEKVFTFSQMAAHFPDPLGIGPIPSLFIAMISDAICTVLLILGLATRWAALFIFCNISVAWAAVHHFAFTGPGGGHGELIVLYLGAMLTLVLAGPGKYSIDSLLDR
jgi:putative oxidoreductase